MRKQNKNNTDRVLRKTVFYGLVLIFLFVLVLNILSSQKIPNLYFRFIEEKADVSVLYLQYIKKSSVFLTELSAQKNIFGSNIAEEVFQRDKERRENIAKLENMLQKNPEARDVLYHLSLLYSEEGRPDLANTYFDRVKNLDPLVQSY
ncbi:MAG: hypothetical protein WC489_01500 [Patescibacteria group bacterium]